MFARFHEKTKPGMTANVLVKSVTSIWSWTPMSGLSLSKLPLTMRPLTQGTHLTVKVNATTRESRHSTIPQN